MIQIRQRNRREKKIIREVAGEVEEAEEVEVVEETMMIRNRNQTHS